MNSSNPKPPILPPKIVQVLRGERGYTESCKDIAELAINRYQSGKAGEPYQLAPPPPGMFPAWAVEVVARFLLACWEQGRRDAEEARP